MRGIISQTAIKILFLGTIKSVETVSYIYSKFY